MDKDHSKQKQANTLLAEAVVAAMYKAVKTLNSPGLMRYFDRFVEAENIKHLVRVPAAQRTTPLAPQVGGSSWSIVEGHLKQSVFAPLLERGMSLRAAGESLDTWEIELQTLTLESLRWPAKASPAGPEGVAFYWLAKLRNAEVIRTIMIAKASQQDTSEVRRTLDLFTL